MPSIWNFELLPIGTKVKLAHNKSSQRKGEVVKHHEKENLMSVLWEGEIFPMHGYMYFELQELEKNDV